MSRVFLIFHDSGHCDVFNRSKCFCHLVRDAVDADCGFVALASRVELIFFIFLLFFFICIKYDLCRHNTLVDVQRLEGFSELSHR